MTLKDKQIKTHLANLEKNLFADVEYDTRKPRPHRFRASSLPICSVKWFLEKVEYKGSKPDSCTMRSDYYTGVGTALHEILQKWSGISGSLYGNWICTHTKSRVDSLHQKSSSCTVKKTKSITHDILIKNKVGPVHCPKCNQLMKYEELSVYHPDTGFSGHVDCLIPYKDGFILIDYKTTSSDKLGTPKSSKSKILKEVPINYFQQVNAYAHLLSTSGAYDFDLRKFEKPLKIYAFGIMYLSRDLFPSRKTKLFLFDVIDEAMVKKEFENYHIAEEAVQTGSLDQIVKHRLCITEKKDPYCEYYPLGCLASEENLVQNLKQHYELHKTDEANHGD